MIDGSLLQKIDFAKQGGLIPAIVQDAPWRRSWLVIIPAAGKNCGSRERRAAIISM